MGLALHDETKPAHRPIAAKAKRRHSPKRPGRSRSNRERRSYRECNDGNAQDPDRQVTCRRHPVPRRRFLRPTRWTRPRRPMGKQCAHSKRKRRSAFAKETGTRPRWRGKRLRSLRLGPGLDHNFMYKLDEISVNEEPRDRKNTVLLLPNRHTRRETSAGKYEIPVIQLCAISMNN
jgi:hypothetical protein